MVKENYFCNRHCNILYRKTIHQHTVPIFRNTQKTQCCVLVDDAY